MVVLVTGGAGYIGSHVVKQLSAAGHTVIVYDNLSTGHADSLLNNEKLIVADLADQNTLNNVFEQYPIEIVMHFAAAIIIPESITQPLRYYANNTVNTFNLLQTCVRHNVKKFIFSSTATVYGLLESSVASEDSPTAPINPYGNSKLMSEWMLKDIAHAHGLRYTILRYFNVAGADPLTRLGQRNTSNTHLIKACCQAALGLRPQIEIYGTNYSTPDGTCIRDYIHVEDIASAHLAALHYLVTEQPSLILNIGYGHGHSVKEVITEVKKISQVDFPVLNNARRAGDPDQLIAKADLIREKFHWTPQHASLNKIITDAWHWECALVNKS